MERIPNEKKDSNVVSMGYDSASHLLEIEFKGGGIYQYAGVLPEVWDAFKGAESKGSFFHAQIKKFYKCEKVFDPRAQLL